MTLTDQINARLSQSGIDGANLEAADGGDRLLVRVDQSGALAITCWELRLTTKRLAGAPIERVRKVAEDITSRVTYLLEPIQPVEADAEACVVQLRSTKPDTRVGSRSYYEVLVKTGGSVSLQRFEAPKGELRRSVSMTLTKEILIRLAEDFLASVS